MVQWNMATNNKILEGHTLENMEPENIALEKEKHLQTTNLEFRRVIVFGCLLAFSTSMIVGGGLSQRATENRLTISHEFRGDHLEDHPS